MEFGCRAHLSYTKGSPPPLLGRKCNYSGQSVRAMPIRILTVGKKRSQGIQLLVEEYKKKINHYCSIEDVLVRSNPKNTSNAKAQIEVEDMMVMQQIRPEDWVVALDENGADLVSEQMANLVGDAGKTVVRRFGGGCEQAGDLSKPEVVRRRESKKLRAGPPFERVST